MNKDTLYSLIRRANEKLNKVESWQADATFGDPRGRAFSAEMAAQAQSDLDEVCGRIEALFAPVQPVMYESTNAAGDLVLMGVPNKPKRFKNRGKAQKLIQRFLREAVRA